ncbi:hypothetical protein QR680_000805 [Steinernema hermaphroditum]|uniref:Serine palmitoyltransferase 1 n=1 Tax=Steinernema hermaphroditum TaxID=289476 RepID=A0AA39LEQ8_9BILA|nr:hypothetical protein QR680_000805 [Steinernema hermaphroditum]
MNDADVERGETAGGWYESVYKWICSNYSTAAYSIVILAYLIGFTEYIYLRLTAYFIPEVTVYRRFCEKRSDEKIGKTGVHYITVLVSFIVIALLQLFAFFLLTISSKLPMEVPEVNEQQRQERPYTRQTRDALFVRSVRENMSKAVYPTFLVYIMCSIIVCATVFYMIGVNDSLDKGLSFVVLIIFDVVVILYFISFPLIAFFFHADIRCCRSAQSAPLVVSQLHGVTGSSARSNIMRYRSRCALLAAGIHSALFVLLWCPAASGYNPIPDESGGKEGEVPWIIEPIYEPHRVHVSSASLDKFQKYRKLTCRDENDHKVKLNDEEYMDQYLEWEQIEFNRALRDTLVTNEKQLNTKEGQDILRVASHTVLDTHFTSKCVPSGESINMQTSKMTTEIREKNLFEDVLINKVMPFPDWTDDPSNRVQYVLELPDHSRTTAFAVVGAVTVKMMGCNRVVEVNVRRVGELYENAAQQLTPPVPSDVNMEILGAVFSFHYAFEALLIAVVIYLLFFRRKPKPVEPKMSERQKDELIDEWTPEPLTPESPQDHPVLNPKFIDGKMGKYVSVDGKKCLNMATSNFLGLIDNERIEEVAKKTIFKYGVGSCGPRGFYGTVDVHLELEKQIAKFMGAEEAVLYSYGFATIASAIPAYAKRGDVVFVDKGMENLLFIYAKQRVLGCNFAIQKGVQASRSRIEWFNHNDMEDLERLLLIQAAKDKQV